MRVTSQFSLALSPSLSFRGPMDKKLETVSRDELWRELDQHGYVVIKNVVSPNTCADIHTAFWDYMGHMNPMINRHDAATWTTDNWPVNTRGLLQHYNVGLQRHAILSRMACKPVFEKLYGTDQLWTSFDGTSFTKRPKVFRYQSVQDWNNKAWERENVHVDQTTEGLKSVQGGLAVVDQEEDGHVFLCVPGSHRYHAEIMALNGGFKPGDWLVMNEACKALLKEKGLQMTRVPMKAGDFVLWDSRTAHASAGYCKTVAATTTRLQVFVCMRPIKPETREVEMKKRQRAYKDGRVSKHNAECIALFGKKPRLYKPAVVEFNVPASAEMSEDEMRVHGLI